MPHNLEIKYESNIKMKSFKNFYIRNNNLVQLQNTSFESPLLTTNSYAYYGDLSLAQKRSEERRVGKECWCCVIMVPVANQQ